LPFKPRILNTKKSRIFKILEQNGRFKMSGPAEGKHKIKVEAYIHEKGKALARITHIDLEGKEISEIIKDKEVTFVRGKQGGIFIALKKPMIERAEKIIGKK